MNTSNTGIAFDTLFLKHDQAGHPENARRLESIISRLKEKSLIDKVTQLKSRLAEIDEIALCHTTE
nr:hypothetical protein [Ignavibacteriaceae bacterium]